MQPDPPPEVAQSQSQGNFAQNQSQGLNQQANVQNQAPRAYAATTQEVQVPRMFDSQV